MFNIQFLVSIFSWRPIISVERVGCLEFTGFGHGASLGGIRGEKTATRKKKAQVNRDRDVLRPFPLIRLCKVPCLGALR